MRVLLISAVCLACASRLRVAQYMSANFWMINLINKQLHNYYIKHVSSTWVGYWCTKQSLILHYLWLKLFIYLIIQNIHNWVKWQVIATWWNPIIKTCIFVYQNYKKKHLVEIRNFFPPWIGKQSKQLVIMGCIICYWQHKNSFF
jgi:hypothetical protein